MGAMAENLYEYEADVLVVGSGAAGFSAAISASLSGASVILFEGNQHVGGTTGLSVGLLGFLTTVRCEAKASTIQKITHWNIWRA